MSQTEAQRVIQLHEDLAKIWRRREPEMRAISHYINPSQTPLTPRGKEDYWQHFHAGLYSSLPIVYKDKMVAQLFATMMSPANEWLAMTIPDQDLAVWKPVRDYLDWWKTFILYSFSASRSTFYPAAIPYLADNVTLGNAVQFDTYNEVTERIRDRTLPLGKALIGRNGDGEQDVMAWLFDRTGPQAVKTFRGAPLPEKVLQRAEKSDHSTKFSFILAVEPNPSFVAGRIREKGKPWKSTVVCKDEPMVIRTEGFFENPVTASTWMDVPEETYGRGQGWVAFSAARLINLQEEAVTRAGQFAAQPINLAADTKVLPRGRRPVPGQTLYGAIVGGRRYFDQLGAPGGIAITVEHQDRKTEELREIFHGVLFHLQGRTGVGDREWFDQHAAQLQQLSPMLTGIETNYLVPKIARRFALGQRMGIGPEPPKELEGQPLQLQMQSAASLAMRASDGAATMQILNDLAPLVQMGGSAAERVSARVDPDGVMEVLQQARGAPSRILRSREDADEATKAERQRAEAMMAAEAAPGMARAVRDLAEAGGQGGGQADAAA